MCVLFVGLCALVCLFIYFIFIWWVYIEKTFFLFLFENEVVSIKYRILWRIVLEYPKIFHEIEAVGDVMLVLTYCG